ncbi:MAG TPA: universal stress protein [Pirellulales bacterium]|nr:universal stress protein [Pirellulales bacterium]
MSIFKNVLVGIDLLQITDQDSPKFSPPVEEAIRHGLWLAETASASITFFAAIAMPDAELNAIGVEEPRVASQLQRLGQRTLDRLVDSARKRGLAADAKLVSGEGWVEIIREVEHGGHDVVIVGTRNVGTVQRLLFGSTAMRLLHNCPCPVWVTRPEPRPFPHNILITSDFSPVSDITIKLGLAVGELSGSKVHLFHAVDYVVDRLYSTGLLHYNADEYHEHVKQEAVDKLREQLVRVAGGEPAIAVELNVVAGESVADSAILDFIQQNEIDLLVMGTIALGGLSGVVIGNTAERLVTHVPCSMLAVKPADFKSPITLPGAAGS